MATGHTTELGRRLQRIDIGSPDGRAAIIEHTIGRLESMARRMLRTSPHVRRWTETNDLLQDSLIRLHRSLADVRPTNPQEFYGLAATQLRRQLIDLARSFYGPHGIGTNNASSGHDAAISHGQPPSDSLAGWTEFHEQVDSLPEAERSVVNLLWYEGLTQSDAADVLNISLATLKRRWQAARLRLAGVMEPPQ